MTINESRPPRGNAGSLANSKSERSDYTGSEDRRKARPGPIDFAAINKAALAAFPAALAAFPAVLARLLPGGKRVGREFLALNPRRRDRRVGSFKINVASGKWSDFATNDRGRDPVSLVAFLAGVSQGEAARLLAQMLGIDSGGRRRG
jgi:hypothetical protein